MSVIEKTGHLVTTCWHIFDKKYVWLAQQYNNSWPSPPLPPNQNISSPRQPFYVMFTFLISYGSSLYTKNVLLPHYHFVLPSQSIYIPPLNCLPPSPYYNALMATTSLSSHSYNTPQYPNPSYYVQSYNIIPYVQ